MNSCPTRPERAEAPSPGRCPGLGAFALYLSLRPVTVGSGHLAAIIWTYDTPFFSLCPRLAQVFEDGEYLAGREILAMLLVA